jgi:hypothetical protein
MAKPGLITLDTTNTFQNWLDSTNDLITLMKTDVLTASPLGDSTNGNATLVGSFSANTINATDTLRFNFAEAIGSISNPVVFRSPITANTSGPATFTHSSAAGPRSLFTNSTVTWQIGFESTANTNFVITTGSGEPRFKVESNGTATANIFRAVSFDGNLDGTANNSINLAGQPASFYRNADNMNAGILPTARLSGTYNITVTDSNNLGGQPGSFYRNADNINSGILPVARLSGTYNINISGNADSSNNSSNLNGQPSSFYTNIPARLGYTPVNASGDETMSGSYSTSGPEIKVGRGESGEKRLRLHNNSGDAYFFLGNGGTIGLFDTISGIRFTSDSTGFFVNGVVSSTTTPSAPNHLTRKDYVDSRPTFSPYIHLQHERDGNPPAPTINNWVSVPLNTVKTTALGIPGASHNTATFALNLPAGTYRARGNHVFGFSGGRPQIRLINSTTSEVLAFSGTPDINGDRGQNNLTLEGTFVLTTSSNIVMQYFTTGGTIGQAASSGATSAFGSLFVEKLL